MCVGVATNPFQGEALSLQSCTIPDRTVRIIGTALSPTTVELRGARRSAADTQLWGVELGPFLASRSLRGSHAMAPVRSGRRHRRACPPAQTIRRIGSCTSGWVEIRRELPIGVC